MARLSRLAFPDQPHCVIQRGNNGQAIFLGDDDRRQWLRMLGEAARVHDVAVHAYALLDDQFQLLLTPRTTQGLSLAMQSLGRLYVSWFNRAHQRSGTLWEGRFRAGVVQAETHLLTCMRVIESGPVRAGLASQADQYAWSSAAHHVGRHRDPLLTDHRLYWGLGNTPFDREASYRALLEHALSDQEVHRVMHAALRGWVLGSADFISSLEADSRRPLAPRPRGRPRRSPAPT